MPISPTRIRAKLKLPRYRAPALVVYARAVVQSLTQNPWFPTTSPSLAAIEPAIDALHLAQAATLTRAKGTTEVRDEARLQLQVLLEQLLAYVQATADRNPENAGSIIESSGLFVEKARTVPPRVFRAKQRLSGSVELFVPRAGRGVAYEWGHSIDGGETWTTLPITLVASVLVTGLPPGVSVLFRYRIITKEGIGDWSDALPLLVQ